MNFPLIYFHKLIIFCIAASVAGSVSSRDCRLEKLKLENGNGWYHFEFSGPLPTAEIKTRIEANSTYTFSQGYDKLLRMQLHSDVFPHRRNASFAAQQFLYNFRNQNLAIYGDSLGLQQFQALENDLFFFCDHSKSANVVESESHWRAAYRHYPEYNVTIQYCLFQMYQLSYVDTMSTCHGFFHVSFFDVDVLLFANSAWYKPEPSHYRNNKIIANYVEMVSTQQTKLFRELYEFRLFLLEHARNTKQKIIYRLALHAGNIDELDITGRYDHPPHNKGVAWDTLESEAIWVSAFNAAFVDIAKMFGDYIMDMYSVSRSAILFSQTVMLPDKDFYIFIHNDHLHFCAGGVFRAANKLLEDFGEHFSRC